MMKSKKMQDQLQEKARRLLQKYPRNLHRKFKTSYIKEINYNNWFSNLIMVKTSNRKLRMFLDFIDFNKSYLKDN